EPLEQRDEGHRHRESHDPNRPGRPATADGPEAESDGAARHCRVGGISDKATGHEATIPDLSPEPSTKNPHVPMTKLEVVPVLVWFVTWSVGWLVTFGALSAGVYWFTQRGWASRLPARRRLGRPSRPGQNWRDIKAGLAALVVFGAV